MTTINIRKILMILSIATVTFLAPASQAFDFVTMARDVRVSLLPECGVANQVEESAAGVVLRRQREIIIKLS